MVYCVIYLMAIWYKKVCGDFGVLIGKRKGLIWGFKEEEEEEEEEQRR